MAGLELKQQNVIRFGLPVKFVERKTSSTGLTGLSLFIKYVIAALSGRKDERTTKLG
jgi:hypothetical protein